MHGEVRAAGAGSRVRGLRTASGALRRCPRWSFELSTPVTVRPYVVRDARPRPRCAACRRRRAWLRWASRWPSGPRGPPTLGKAMLNKYARAFFTRVLTPFAAFLLRRGVSPDAVTLIGTAGVVAGALVFFPRGRVLLGHDRHHPVRLLRPRRRQHGPPGRAAPAAGAPSWTPPSTGSPTAAIFGGLALWYAGARRRQRAVRGRDLLPGQRPGGVVHQGARRVDRAAGGRQRARRARRAAGDLAGRRRPGGSARLRGARHRRPAADRPVDRRRRQRSSPWASGWSPYAGSRPRPTPRQHAGTAQERR